MEETKVTKENFYAAVKPIKIWDVNVDSIVICKLVKAKTNSKYLIGYLDKAIRPLSLIISGYVKLQLKLIFKVKDKDKSNKMMSFRIDDDKLLEKYEIICTKILN